MRALTFRVTPLVLLLLGLPLAMHGRGRGAWANLWLCLGVGLSFFATTLLLERLGARSDFIDPLLGALIPPVIFGSAGLLMFESTR